MRKSRHESERDAAARGEHPRADLVEDDGQKEDEEREKRREKNRDLHRDPHIKTREALVAQKQHRDHYHEYPAHCGARAPRVERKESAEKAAERELHDDGDDGRRVDPELLPQARCLDEVDEDDAGARSAQVKNEQRVGRPKVHACRRMRLSEMNPATSESGEI